MPRNVDPGRRKSLMLLAGAVGSLPILLLRDVEAADVVSEQDELAMQLGYVTEASRADTGRFPKRAEPGGDQQFCRTCQFFKADSDSGTGGCVVFGGRTVRAGGWCNSWFKKTG